MAGTDRRSDPLRDVDLSTAVQSVVDGDGSPQALEVIEASGFASLAELAPLLSDDHPLERVEAVERVLKQVLRRQLLSGLSGPMARRLARYQQTLGFLFKYKSYAVKASTPLGYSIFIQNAGEGFSFQRHRVHKTEIFHILSPSPGAFVFLCEFEDWVRSFEAGPFADWLAGEPDPRYERFRFTPEPGDVIVIDTVGVVHSVVGCVLEEFASVSTDMVDRLFDQNVGRPVPPEFHREAARKRLREAATPTPRRRIRLGERGLVVEEIRPAATVAGWRILLGETPALAAHHVSVEPGRQTPLEPTGGHAVSLCILRGQGEHRIVGRSERNVRSVAPLLISQGDTILVPPGVSFSLSSSGSETLVASQHWIRPGVALI
jgi:mannose-6-phosphate isomerase-like protein (cupin superfamily)